MKHYTSDVDLTISIEREQLPALFRSLQLIGCDVPLPFRDGWLDTVGGLPLFKAEFPGNGRLIEIDFFISETPFQRSLIERRSLIETPDGEMAFVSPEDLVLLKLIASRPKDLIDIQDILFTMGQLDLAYLETWAQELTLTNALHDALDQFKRDN